MSILLARAHMHREIGETTCELADYKAMVKLTSKCSSPSRPEVLCMRANRYGELGELEKAICDYAAIIADPDVPAGLRHVGLGERGLIYLQAGKPDTAGVIFARQEEWARAAEAYMKAGNESVAAEMFEKAGDWRRAAESYQSAEFPRQAADAWTKCQEWQKAAQCLEDVILEGMTGAGHGDAARQAETKTAREIHTNFTLL